MTMPTITPAATITTTAWPTPNRAVPACRPPAGTLIGRGAAVAFGRNAAVTD